MCNNRGFLTGVGSWQAANWRHVLAVFQGENKEMYFFKYYFFPSSVLIKHDLHSVEKIVIDNEDQSGYCLAHF